MDALIIFTIIVFWFLVLLGIRNWSAYVGEKRLVLSHVSELTSIDAFDKKQRTKKKKANVFEQLTRYSDEFADLGQRINFFSENIEVGDARAFRSIGDMVADPRIDAIWLCGPNQARVENVAEIVESHERRGVEWEPPRVRPSPSFAYLRALTDDTPQDRHVRSPLVPVRASHV